MAKKRPVIALTGATGYVGGLLVQPLCEMASEVRCITRDASRLSSDLPPNATAVQADVGESNSIEAALTGCDIAFYLVHSLGEGDDFSRAEAEAAETFAAAAKSAGVRRIIYLGALAQGDSSEVSPHIASRHRAGEILESSGVPVTEFRASVVIGAGSMPFEAIRALVERLPVMVTPRWVRMPVQPISARDLVSYLVAAAAETGDQSHVYEIGGGDVTTYAELMRAYARHRGLRRFMIPVPVITPRLSSLWLRLVTPAHYRIGRNIVDSTSHSSVVADHSAEQSFGIKPLKFEAAIEQALTDENQGLQFLDIGETSGSDTFRTRLGTKFVERRRIEVSCDEETAFNTISRVGGQNGWFWGDWLWRVRGFMDRIAGGPGLRKNSTAYPPKPGNILDFWTVERFGDNRLTLHADMRLPGDAWLALRVRTINGKTCIEQTAAFDPKGILGIAYWFALYPLHSLVFRGMLRGAKRAAENSATELTKAA